MLGYLVLLYPFFSCKLLDTSTLEDAAYLLLKMKNQFFQPLSYVQLLTSSKAYSRSSFTSPQRQCLRCQSALFSTSAPLSLKTKDGNRKRGVSALRRTGPRYPRSISKEPLPQPILDPARRSKVQVNEKHGLWEFFDNGKNPFEKPEVVAAHGTIDRIIPMKVYLHIIQDAHGQSRSCGISLSKIYIACGGFVSKREIGF